MFRAHVSPKFSSYDRVRQIEPRHGFARRDLIAIIVIVLLLAGLAIPLMIAKRSDSREMTCRAALLRVGEGIAEYAERHQMFPTSGWQPGMTHVDLERVKPGSTEAEKAAYSWTFAILPFIGQQVVYDSVKQEYSPFLGDPQKDVANRKVAAEPITNYRCPDYAAPPYSTFEKIGPAYGVRGAWIGNYKALGATSKASLFGAEPNGVINPRIARRLSDLKDGITNTLLACESIESGYGAWIDGATAAIYGLGPENLDVDARFDPSTKEFPPSDTQIKVMIQNSRDEPIRVATNPFEQGVNWEWGPSSYHPGGVIHLYSDFHVQVISPSIDRGIYYSLITVAGGEEPPQFRK